MANIKLSFLERELQLQLEFGLPDPFYLAHFWAQGRCWCVVHKDPHLLGVGTIDVMGGPDTTEESMAQLAHKMNLDRGFA